MATYKIQKYNRKKNTIEKKNKNAIRSLQKSPRPHTQTDHHKSKYKTHQNIY